jgi:lipoate-protein ligase A
MTKVSEALADGLREMGIDARVSRREQALPRQAGVCFESTTRYEFLADGQKVVGNAQYRSPTGFLQHGSMPLYPTVSCLRSLAGHGRDGRESSPMELSRLRHDSLDRIGALLAEAFAERFRASLVWKPHAEIDIDAVNRLAAGRYARPDWTFRR